MTVFADSSALVKRYADGAHHQTTRDIHEPITASALARVEVPAALWRKLRMGELSDEHAAALIAAFELDWFGGDTRPPSFGALQITGPILDAAARQVARHGLRAYDAIQLATALTVRELDPATTFAAFDGDLRAAAAREGFILLPRTLDHQ